jgi:PAS domain-containing protein
MAVILAEWHRQFAKSVLSAIFLELLVVALIFVSIRHLRGRDRLRAAEAALVLATEKDRASVELRTQWQRFEKAMNNMRQGLAMFDRAEKLIVANRRAKELCGLRSTRMSLA